MGWIVFGVRSSILEWVALVVSFFGLILMYIGTEDQTDQGGVSKFQMILGCFFAIISSALFAGIAVLNRLLEDVPTSVALFYAGAVAVIISIVMSFSEHFITEKPIQTFSYGLSEYCFIIVACLSNFVALSFLVIAC